MSNRAADIIQEALESWSSELGNAPAEYFSSELNDLNLDFSKYVDDSVISISAFLDVCLAGAVDELAYKIDGAKAAGLDWAKARLFGPKNAEPIIRDAAQWEEDKDAMEAISLSHYDATYPEPYEQEEPQLEQETELPAASVNEEPEIDRELFDSWNAPETNQVSEIANEILRFEENRSVKNAEEQATAQEQEDPQLEQEIELPASSAGMEQEALKPEQEPVAEQEQKTAQADNELEEPQPEQEAEHTQGADESQSVEISEIQTASQEREENQLEQKAEQPAASVNEEPEIDRELVDSWNAPEANQASEIDNEGLRAEENRSVENAEEQATAQEQEEPLLEQETELPSSSARIEQEEPQPEQEPVAEQEQETAQADNEVERAFSNIREQRAGQTANKGREQEETEEGQKI